MNRKKFCNRLDLNDKIIPNSQINPETTIQLPAFINNRYGLLSLKFYPLQSQFVAQALFVCGF